jgi:gliding motility-associated-like protein
VQDNTAPLVSCPADLTVDCDDPIDPASTGTATATDNCDPATAVTYSDATAGGACPQEFTITRTWTATDDCGNTSNCTQLISVEDNTAPLVSCPADLTVDCDDPIDPAATGTATAIDNCDPTPAVSYSDATAGGACPQEFTITRTWTATDDCGNSSNCTQLISVEDNTAPLVSCPADLTVECDDPTDPAATGTATATDNCDPATAVTYSDATAGGACPQEFNITRTWTATDECNNLGTCVQFISIVDTTPPSIICPADLVATCDISEQPPYQDFSAFSANGGSANDNCGLNEQSFILFSEISDGNTCPELLTRSYQINDECGNSSTCTQGISIFDQIPPEIENPPADIIVNCLELVPPIPDLIWTDNCDGSGWVSGIPESNGMNNPEIITVSWTVTDNCGNETTVTQLITVFEKEHGSISAQICQGETYNFNGEILSVEGTYMDTLTASNGCDSIVTLALTINPVYNTTVSTQICQGETYNFNGEFLSEPGEYTDTLQTINGCDSIQILTLTVNPVYETQMGVEICEGESYVFNGELLVATGIYTDTMQTVEGCDSIVLLNLTILPVYSDTTFVTLCQGESIFWNGILYDATVVVADTLPMASGCDSILTLVLEVYPVSQDTVLAGICTGEVYLFNGVEYNTTGFFSDTLNSIFGCDSIQVLNLTVYPPVEPVIQGDSMICEGDTATLEVWNATGVFLWSTLDTTSTISPTAEGWYEVWVTDANGCAGLDSFLVSFAPAAIPPTGPDTEITCENPAFPLGEFPAPPGIYQWTGPSISPVNAGDPNPVVSLNGWYFLTFTNTFGCTAADSVFVGLDPYVPHANAGPDMELTCDFPAISLLGGSSISNPVFLWSGPGINSGNENEQTPLVSEPGWYILTVLDTLADCISLPDSVLVIPNNILPEVEIQSDAVIDCNTLQAILDGTNSSSGPDFTYTWITPDSPIFDLLSITVDEGGWYYLTVENTGTGCLATDSIFVVENTELPLVIIQLPEVLSCQSQVVVLNGLGSTEGPLISISWSGPAGGIVSGGNTLTPTVQLPGTYVLTITNEENGCSNSSPVEVSQDIVAPLVDLPEEAYISCLTNSGWINPIQISQGGNFEYAWFTDEGVILQIQPPYTMGAGAPGWYYLEVLNSANGCSSIDSVWVNYLNPPTDAFINISDACWGETNGTIEVTSVAGGAGPYYFELTGPITLGNSTGVFHNLPPGAYDLLIMDVNDCEWDTSLIVGEFGEILVDLGPDVVTLSLGESYELDPTVNIPEGAIETFFWNPTVWLDCPDCFAPVTTPLDTIAYTLTVIDTNGCKGSDNILIILDDELKFFIPNIFSPNGDMKNDVFLIYAGPGVRQIRELKIYDRWGELVFANENFQPNDPNSGWDGNFLGEPMNSQVFAYYTIIELIDGREIRKHGSLTLIR